MERKKGVTMLLLVGRLVVHAMKWVLWLVKRAAAAAPGHEPQLLLLHPQQQQQRPPNSGRSIDWWTSRKTSGGAMKEQRRTAALKRTSTIEVRKVPHRILVHISLVVPVPVVLGKDSQNEGTDRYLLLQQQ
jgi:hypothetical protein